MDTGSGAGAFRRGDHPLPRPGHRRAAHSRPRRGHRLLRIAADVAGYRHAALGHLAGHQRVRRGPPCRRDPRRASLGRRERLLPLGRQQRRQPCRPCRGPAGGSPQRRSRRTRPRQPHLQPRWADHLRSHPPLDRPAPGPQRLRNQPRYHARSPGHRPRRAGRPGNPRRPSADRQSRLHRRLLGCHHAGRDRPRPRRPPDRGRGLGRAPSLPPRPAPARDGRQRGPGDHLDPQDVARLVRWRPSDDPGPAHRRPPAWTPRFASPSPPAPSCPCSPASTRPGS